MLITGSKDNVVVFHRSRSSARRFSELVGPELLPDVEEVTLETTSRPAAAQMIASTVARTTQLSLAVGTISEIISQLQRFQVAQGWTSWEVELEEVNEEGEIASDHGEVHDFEGNLD